MMLAYHRVFRPSLLQVLQALEVGLLKSSPSLQHSIQYLQQYELKSLVGGGGGGGYGPPPSVTPASGGTPIEMMRRMTGTDGTFFPPTHPPTHPPTYLCTSAAAHSNHLLLFTHSPTHTKQTKTQREEGRVSAGFAFSADPITLEAERRKIIHPPIHPPTHPPNHPNHPPTSTTQPAAVRVLDLLSRLTLSL